MDLHEAWNGLLGNRGWVRLCWLRVNPLASGMELMGGLL